MADGNLGRTGAVRHADAVRQRSAASDVRFTIVLSANVDVKVRAVTWPEFC